MPDLKVSIGGRNYQISCNPGEENATIESARLFDKEAELIQGQIGRLSEDKMLLLSGLLLGNKIVELQSEKKELEEKLARTESSVKESSFKNEDHQQVKMDQSNVSNANDLAFEREKNQVMFLQKVSNLLDDLIQEFEKEETKKVNDLQPTKVTNEDQKSFL